MRLFIGIELPEDLKKNIYEFLLPIQLSSKGWEHPHDYHQTMLFIGETLPEKLEEIKLRMNDIVFSPFTLTTKGFSFFNRRILYLDLLPSEDLLQLKRIIDLKFPEYIRPNERPFVSHVTVKRWQRYEYDHLVEGIQSRPFKDTSFAVSELALFKSERDVENLKYHVIHKVSAHFLIPD